MRFIAFSSTLLLCLCLAAPALAFHRSSSFGRPATVGGGAEVFFTGAARWKRYDCSICHTQGESTFSIGLSSDPAELIAKGVWQPGQSYQIQVEMQGETLGFQSSSNTNTFLAEIGNNEGYLVSEYEFDANSLAVWNEGQVIGAVDNANQTLWSFRFTAPAAGTGALSLNLAMVDGNGANVMGAGVDAAGDATASAYLTWCESGVPCMRDEPAKTTGAALGCSSTQGHTSLIALVALLFLLMRAVKKQR